MRRRVTLVSRIFDPEPSAASFRLTALVRGLAAAGAQVDVLTSTPPDGAGPGVDLPAKVHRARVLRDKSGYLRGYLPYLSFDLPLVWRVLRAGRVDGYVVEPPPTTGAMVRVLAALRRTPYIYYAADVWSDAAVATGAPGVVVRVVRALERFALRGAAGVLSVSDGLTQRVEYLGGRQVATVGNGVDTEIFTPDAPAREATPSEIPDEPFLLYAGSASEWHGAEVFAQAMPQVLERVPQAQVVFLGQGSSWPRLKELAQALPPGAVTLLDKVSAADSAVWQRNATASLVSLTPGIGYDFAVPTKMYAALGCGTPIVFVGPLSAPALRVVAEERLGWVGEHSVEEAARLMITALQTVDEPAERARRAAWVVKNRSLAVVGERAAQVVLEKCAEPRTG